jgi:hypothetical protein
MVAIASQAKGMAGRYYSFVVSYLSKEVRHRWRTRRSAGFFDSVPSYELTPSCGVSIFRPDRNSASFHSPLRSKRHQTKASMPDDILRLWSSSL